MDYHLFSQWKSPNGKLSIKVYWTHKYLNSGRPVIYVTVERDYGNRTTLKCMEFHKHGPEAHRVFDSLLTKEAINEFHRLLDEAFNSDVSRILQAFGV